MLRAEHRPDRSRFQMQFPHAGTNLLEVELETAPGELTPANNRAVISAEGVRENLRVLLVSGEPHAGERTWRNLLEVRCCRRPRALHHSASARETGRHADQSALSHRLSDQGAVLGQDQGFRSHHLRQVCPPRHPADALLRQHLALRGPARRRAARRGRRRLRRHHQPLSHAAGPGLARAPDGPRHRGAVQGARHGGRRSSIRSRADCPAPAARMPTPRRHGAAGSARSKCVPTAAAP